MASKTEQKDYHPAESEAMAVSDAFSNPHHFPRLSEMTLTLVTSVEEGRRVVRLPIWVEPRFTQIVPDTKQLVPGIFCIPFLDSMELSAVIAAKMKGRVNYVIITHVSRWQCQGICRR